MKNGLLIWNIVLTLIAGYLLFTHFSSKKGDAVPLKHEISGPDVANRPFRIAFFDMDSVENNFLMVKDVQAEINQREKEYNNDLGKLDGTYKERVAGYRQKASSMTQEEYEKAQMDLRQLEDQLKSQKQGIDQDYQDFVMRRKLALKNEIKEYLKDYNKDKKYTYIVVYEQDLYYYQDTAYDITRDLIQGLNERYRTKKK